MGRPESTVVSGLATLLPAWWERGSSLSTVLFYLLFLWPAGKITIFIMQMKPCVDGRRSSEGVCSTSLLRCEHQRGDLWRRGKHSSRFSSPGDERASPRTLVVGLNCIASPP